MIIGLHPDPLPRKTALALLVIVVAMGAFLRLDGLADRGLVMFDEGMYAREGQFIRSVFDNAASFAKLVKAGAGQDSFMDAIKGLPPSTGKPGHGVLVFATSLFTGMTPYAALFVNALFGILTIPAVYAFGARFWDRTAGVLGAAVLSVSGLHVYYSRSALAEATATFFLVAAFLLVVKRIQNREDASFKSLVLGGLCLGLAFVCNYRVLYIILPFLMVVGGWILLFGRGRGFWARIADTAYACVSAAVPVLAFQVPYWILRLFGVSTQRVRLNGYLELVIAKFTQTTGQSHPLLHDLYLRGLNLLEGPWILILCLAGLAYVLFRFKILPGWVVAVSALLPVLAFSVSTRGDRFVAISFTAPFIAMLAALGLRAALRLAVRERLDRIVVPVCVVLVLAAGYVNASWLMDMRSGWEEVVAFARTHGGEKAGIYNMEVAVVKALTDRNGGEYPPRTMEELARDMKENGFGYLAVDWKKYHDDNYSDLVKEIEERCEPVAAFERNVYSLPVFADDFHFTHDNSSIIVNAATFEELGRDPQVNSIVLYDLRQCLPEAK